MTRNLPNVSLKPQTNESQMNAVKREERNSEEGRNDMRECLNSCLITDFIYLLRT